MAGHTTIFQEQNFPGRTLLGWGVGIMAVVWLSGIFINWEAAPPAASVISQICLVIGFVIYLIGYWKAVKGKGYPQLLWLAAFTHIIGLVLILYLPDKSGEALTDRE
jgi:hypothetical protein